MLIAVPRKLNKRDQLRVARLLAGAITESIETFGLDYLRPQWDRLHKTLAAGRPVSPQRAHTQLKKVAPPETANPDAVRAVIAAVFHLCGLLGDGHSGYHAAECAGFLEETGTQQWLAIWDGDPHRLIDTAAAARRAGVPVPKPDTTVVLATPPAKS